MACIARGTTSDCTYQSGSAGDEVVGRPLHPAAGPGLGGNHTTHDGTGQSPFNLGLGGGLPAKS